jgi:hypothetical protein
MKTIRKELVNLEMSMIIRKYDKKMRVTYGLRTQGGHIYDGRFHMLKKPQISAILGHLFRIN